MKKSQPGTSFAEVIVVVLFIAILSAIAIPRFSFSMIYKKNAETLSRKMVTDLRFARRLAISDAANNSDGYEMNIGGSSYTIDNMDTSEEILQHDIASEINVTGGTLFQFHPLGYLIGGSDTGFTVEASGRSFTITIVPATGTVTCVEN